MPVRRLGLVSAVVMAMTMISACEQPRPIPPGTDRFYYGHLLEGEKFGVWIGMSQVEATTILAAQGLHDHGVHGCSSYPRELLACDSQDVFHRFTIREFSNNGSIFLNIEDEKVTAISWSFAIIRFA